jgi:GxxExxY protein
MKEFDNDPLTGRIIAAAIMVHRELGPGFLESIYEEAMAVALEEAGLPFARQYPVVVNFRGRVVGNHRLDFLVEASVVLELKAVAGFDDVHFAIVRSYVRATDARCGLLLNFAAPTLQVKRIGPEFRRQT